MRARRDGSAQCGQSSQYAGVKTGAEILSTHTSQPDPAGGLPAIPALGRQMGCLDRVGSYTSRISKLWVQLRDPVSIEEDTVSTSDFYIRVHTHSHAPETHTHTHTAMLA